MGDHHLRQGAKLADWLIKGLAVLGVAAFGAAALVTVVDILGRRIGYPIEGVVDLVQLSVVTGGWLTMPFAFYAAAHVTVDFLLAALPTSLTVPLKVLGALASFVLVGLMLWQGYLTFETRTMFGDKSQQLGIPVAWYWYPLLVGLAVSLLAILLGLVTSIKQELGHE